MKILFIGDVVGRPGRRAVRALLPGLVSTYGPDLVIANAENAAGGMGITGETAKELLVSGVDVLTTGNHAWNKKESVALMDSEPRVLRPANYPGGVPGRGMCVIDVNKGTKRARVAVVNLEGRVFLRPLDCPFRCADDVVQSVAGKADFIVVDFHAEATSEKMALGWYLDGKVTAVIGTHTHVQTADERILPGGTAYITDVGMVGPVDSVIGVEKETIIERFLTQIPSKFEVAGGPVALHAVIVEADDVSGRAVGIRRIKEWLKPSGG